MENFMNRLSLLTLEDIIDGLELFDEIQTSENEEILNSHKVLVDKVIQFRKDNIKMSLMPV